jgi:hypothetical protein
MYDTGQSYIVFHFSSLPPVLATCYPSWVHHSIADCTFLASGYRAATIRGITIAQTADYLTFTWDQTCVAVHVEVREH